MTPRRPHIHDTAEDCAEAIFSTVGKRVVLGLPLGLGKPNHIANALYDRAARDPSLRLEILTALTLAPPRGRSELERRFLGPMFERLAPDYPLLAYDRPQREGRLPPNITVRDFFLPAGRRLRDPLVQQSYVSANYTHVARDLLARGINVAAQLVARRGEGSKTRYSLSCNTDVALDLVPAMLRRRAAGEKIVVAGQVNDRLPFMSGPAAIGPEYLDIVLDSPHCQFSLFPLPKQPVDLSDYAAALHVASLIEDGGTLQIGIGAFADALTQVLKLRHTRNAEFRELIARLGQRGEGAPPPQLEPFEDGLYAASEMLVEGLLELKAIGVVKRRVATDGDQDQAGEGPMIHAAFFLGAAFFYDRLRAMPEEELADIAMTAVSFVNQLYGDEDLKRGHRVKARFVNNALMATLLGAAVSDGLEDGRVISGVGGQYNFVAMAHELEDARSILAFKSARKSRGRPVSNVLWQYGHVTIPRHLRDVFVTEYGIADLRGRSDSAVIARMLAIADSRFQDGLLGEAREAGKIARDYRVPDAFRNNRPGRIEQTLGPARAAGLLPEFPLGSDMTQDELALVPALGRLKEVADAPLSQARLAARAIFASAPSPTETGLLARLDLASPKSFREHLMARVVLSALRAGQEGG